MDSNSTATGNDFYGCMYTCLYIGQNDDQSSGDTTSWNLTVSGNRMKPWTDPATGIYYRVSVPIAVRNVTGALVENNTFDPRCIGTVQVVASPQLSGRAAGNNMIQNNVVQIW